MISPFWTGRTGKLVIGGCGTQLGMLVTLGGLLAVMVLCSVCLSVNALVIGLSRSLVPPPPPGVVTGAAANEVQDLIQDLNLLLTEIETFQANAPVAAALIKATPVPPPFVVARESNVALYNGPGADYGQIGSLPGGQPFEIVGRSDDSNWWLIALPEGSFAWVAGQQVSVANVSASIPVVMPPSRLGQPAASSDLPAGETPTPTLTSTPPMPSGTPTPTSAEERQYVGEMPAYQRVKEALFVPPVNASLSPDGKLIAMTERIKLYTVGTAGAHTDVWLEDNAQQGPLGGTVWSPDGKHLAFVVGFKDPKCGPCRAVALLRMSDGLITYLKDPEGLDTDMPRWTQDGRLLANVHPGEPADGIAYVYDISGQRQEAEGVYLLSSSQEGQKWYPWLPGRVWRAGVSERADSYNSD